MDQEKAIKVLQSKLHLDGKVLEAIEEMEARIVAVEALKKQVELVRCGECIHRTSGRYGLMCFGRPNDFFCANGERRKYDEKSDD